MIKHVESLYRSAIGCDLCFDGYSRRQRAGSKMPSPRAVGPRYFHSDPRILLVTVRPGAGSRDTEAQTAHYNWRDHAFARGELSLAQLSRDHIDKSREWVMNTRYEQLFGAQGIELDREEIAQLNVALCQLKTNSPEPGMLTTCWRHHTRALLEALAPDVVLVSGSDIRRFAPKVREVLPNGLILPMLHYAHRGGHSRTWEEVVRIRRQLVNWSPDR